MSLTMEQATKQKEDASVLDYRAALEAVRAALAGTGSYPRTLPAATVTPATVPVELSGGGKRPGIPPVTLIYSRADAYIYGFSWADEGRTSTKRFFGEDAEKAMGSQVPALKFKPAYSDMGWQKDKDLRTVRLDEVLFALNRIAKGKEVTKDDMVAILVGFAEAARFKDIEEQVIAGTPIDGKTLDWSGARSKGDLLLQKAPKKG